MNATYQNPAHVASFAGVDAFYRALDAKVPRKNIKKYAVVYRIKDLLGESVQGTFYAQEMQLVDKKENTTPLKKF